MPFPKKTVDSNKPREVCPAETMRGLVTRIIYIGTIPNTYDPDKPPAEQIVLFFELDAEDSEGRRHVLSKTLTYSLHEKSTLSKWFSPILGSEWPKPNEEFDAETLLGLTVMASVVHYIKQDGTIGAKINSVSKLARGMEPMESDSDQCLISYDDPQFAESKLVPQWVRDQAATNIESCKIARPAPAVSPKMKDKPGKMNFGPFNATPVDMDDVPY